MGLSRRIQAAVFSFMAGVMPPMPMLGDTLLVGDNVTIEGSIDLQDGDNQITIGSNNLFNGTIYTGSGIDTFTAGDGNTFTEQIDTGAGDDDLTFGDGNFLEDIWTGEGSDILRTGALDTSSTSVLDGVHHTGDDGDPLNDDTLHLQLSPEEESDLINELVANGYVLNGNTWSASGGTDYHVTSGNLVVNDWENIRIVCFATGTRIETDRGMRPIEWLKPGDMVRTQDNGFQSIRWVGSKKVEAQGHLAPYIVEPDTLGNTRRLRLSPQHRVLLSGWQTELLFGESEVLAAVKMLDNGHSIRMCTGGSVRYYHMLFDRHEIVFADGAAVESFHPGSVGMSALDQDVRDEVCELFPELRSGAKAYGSVARPCLRSHEARVVAELLGLPIQHERRAA